MKVIIIDESTEEGRELLNILYSMKRSGNPAIIRIQEYEIPNSVQEPSTPYLTSKREWMDNGDDDLDMIPFSPIPGMPYTHEERMAELRQVEEDIKNGVPGITLEELDEEMKTW